MVTCAKCDAAVDFDEDELDEGDEFTCEECGANLRVLSVGPIELVSADEKNDEDEDDEDDDEEEDDDDDAEEAEEGDADWR